MAVVHSTRNPSMRGSPLALPLQVYLGDCQQRQDPAEAADVLRQLIANAGVLEDAAPGGERFVLAVLPPDLLGALATFVQTPQPLPLLEWSAAQ